MNAALLAAAYTAAAATAAGQEAAAPATPWQGTGIRARRNGADAGGETASPAATLASVATAAANRVTGERSRWDCSATAAAAFTGRNCRSNGCNVRLASASLAAAAFS
jgi:hypothetical protein